MADDKGGLVVSNEDVSLVPVGSQLQDFTTSKGAQMDGYTAANADEAMQTGSGISLQDEEINEGMIKAGELGPIRDKFDSLSKVKSQANTQVMAEAVLLDETIQPVEKAEMVDGLVNANLRRQVEVRPASMEELASGLIAAKSSIDDYESMPITMPPGFEDYLAVEMYSNSKLEELRNEAEAVGVAGTVFNFLEFINPISTVASQVTLGELLPDANVQEIRAQLADPAIPLQQKTQLIDTIIEDVKRTISFSTAGLDNQERVLQTVNNILKGSELERDIESAFFALDLVPVVGGAAKTALRPVATRTARSLSGLRRNPTEVDITVGNRTDAVARTVKDTNTISTSPVTGENVDRTLQTFDNLIPSYLSSKNLLNENLGISATTDQALKESSEALNILAQQDIGARLDVPTLQTAIEETAERLRMDVNPKRILDMQIPKADEVRASILDDVTQVTMRLGSTTGSGYSSREVAERAAQETLGWSDFKVNQLNDGKWVIDITKSVDESNYFNGVSAPVVPETFKGWTDGLMGKYLLGGRLVQPEKQYTSAAMADIAKDAIGERVVGELKKPLNNLNFFSRRKVGNKLSQAQVNQKWHVEDELISEGFSQKEINAYYSLVQLNNTDWFVRNAAMYKSLKIQGVEEIETTLGGVKRKFQGKVVTRPQQIKENQLRVWDDELQDTIPMTKEQLSKTLEDEAKVLLRITDEAIDFGTGPAKYAITGRSGIKTSEIGTQVLPYTEGGHRYYSGKFFIKQDNLGSYSDGTKWVGNPLTHFVAETSKSATERAADLQDLIDKYNMLQRGEVEEVALSTALSKNNMKSLDEFERLVDTGKVNLKSKVEVVQDGELTAGLRAAGSLEGAVDLTDEGVTYAQQYFVTNGKSSSARRKGEHLLNPQDTLAPTLHPFEAASKGLNNALNTGVMFNYQTAAMSNWLSKAAPFLSKTDAGKSDWQKFMNPTWLDDNPSNIQLALQAEQRAIQRMLVQETPFSRGWNNMMNRFGLSLENVPKGERASKIAYSLQDSDPVSALKGVIYHAKLGLFNVSQWFLQQQSALSAIAIDPKHGSRAWMDSYLVRGLRAGGWRDDMIEASAARMSNINGLSMEDTKQMLLAMRDSNFLEVGSSISQLSDLQPNYLNTVFSGKIREAGTFFFKEGEMINRGTSYGTAWRRVRATNPDLDMASQAAREMVFSEASKINMNMTRAGSSDLQVGLTSLGTQFRGFQFRFLESLVSPKAGLTKAERSRLALSQMALYGARNTPVLGRMTEDYFESQEDRTALDAFMQDGFYSWLAFAASGGDIDITTEALSATGGIEDLLGVLFDEDTSLLEAALGPVYSTGKQINYSFESLWYANSIIQNNQVESFDAGDIQTLFGKIAQPVSSLTRLQKGAFAYKYGMFLNSKGSRVLANDVSKAEAALYTVFGVTPREATELFEEYQKNKKFNDKVKDTTEMVVAFTLEAFKSGDSKLLEGALATLEADGNVDPRVKATVQSKMWNELRKRLTPEQWLQMQQIKRDIWKYQD